MRLFSVILRLGAAAALVVSATAHAGQRNAVKAPREFSAEYKATHYCMLCHGRGARGFVAYRPIPQLAGQQAQYIELQLAAFADRRRQRDLGYVRYENVHKLTPDQRSALAEYMSKLEPLPHKSASESSNRRRGNAVQQWLPRERCSRLRGVPWPGREGQRDISSSRRSVEAVPHRPTHRLGQAAGFGSGRQGRQFQHYGANRKKLNPATDQGSYGLPQQLELARIKSSVPAFASSP